MKLNVHDANGIVEIWQTAAEKNDPKIQEDLKKFYQKYKEKKYTVAVFQAGGQDLYQCTRDLLVYNKKRSAELFLQSAKRQRSGAEIGR